MLIKGEIKKYLLSVHRCDDADSVRIEVDEANSDDDFDTSEDVDSDGYLNISLDSSELQYLFSIYGNLEVGGRCGAGVQQKRKQLYGSGCD